MAKCPSPSLRAQLKTPDAILGAASASKCHCIAVETFPFELIFFHKEMINAKKKTEIYKQELPPALMFNDNIQLCIL